MRKLKLVGEAIGPARTNSDLIPYLRTKTDSEDELLLCMAAELGTFVPSLVTPADAYPILEILEILCGVEETVVRSEAVASLVATVDALRAANEPGLGPFTSALIARLAQSEWFTGRVSAAGLFAAAYPCNDDSGKEQLRSFFGSLSSDETPMVRRGIAKALGELVTTMDGATVISEMVPIYKKLASDEQDSVRTLAASHAASFAKVLGEVNSVNEHVFGTFKNSCQDRSWRVRHGVGEGFATTVAAFNFTGDPLLQAVQCYVDLAKDGEAEVRAAASSNLATLVDLVGEEVFVTNIAECLDDLAKDPVMEVRSKLAQAVMDTVSGGKLSDGTVLAHFQPLLLNLHKSEEESDEVKIHVLRKLPVMANLLPKMSDIVAVVKALAKYEANWRVRSCVAAVLPALASANGIADFEAGSSSFLSLYHLLLQDQVASVRTSCVEGVHKLYLAACAETPAAGATWIQKSVLDPLKPTYESATFYQTRITFLALYASLCPDDATPKALLEEIVGLFLAALDDPVPNVRACAAEHLLKVVGFCNDALISGQIRPKIMTVCETTEVDKEDEMDADQDLRVSLRKLVVCMDS
jgi:serine/threonine-protein phosphatase 2A regulatory subunit A